MEVSGQLHAPTTLHSGKERWYPLDRTLGGPKSRSRRCGEGKKLLHCRESKPGRPARSSSLYRLSYPKSWIISLLYVFRWPVCLDYSAGVVALVWKASSTPLMKPQLRDRVSGLHSLGVTFPPHDSSYVGSNLAEEIGRASCRERVWLPV
jgi:hypothetical protein